jgi:hypothetical protein
MTQDVSAQSLSLNFHHGADAVISTFADDWGKNHLSPGSTRAIRRLARPPQNSMIRLAVLNTLRPASSYQRS